MNLTKELFTPRNVNVDSHPPPIDAASSDETSTPQTSPTKSTPNFPPERPSSRKTPWVRSFIFVCFIVVVFLFFKRTGSAIDERISDLEFDAKLGDSNGFTSIVSYNIPLPQYDGEEPGHLNSNERDRECPESLDALKIDAVVPSSTLD